MPRARLILAAFASALLAAPAPAQSPAAQVIQLQSFAIAPNPIRLSAGVPVTLTFQNASGSGHDFTAPEFFAASRFVAGAAPGGKIALAGRESRTVALVPAAGTYAAHCSHFLHASMGMRAQILVQ